MKRKGQGFFEFAILCILLAFGLGIAARVLFDKLSPTQAEASPIVPAKYSFHSYPIDWDNNVAELTTGSTTYIIFYGNKKAILLDKKESK